MRRADDRRTLAVDIGGSGIKLALLDERGQMIGERLRVPTPPAPVSPEALARTIEEAAAPFGEFGRASVGFPGAVRNGRILTAPHLGTELWAGFELEAALGARWGKPVRVVNDADLQGLGAIGGRGVEMVLTLGTGVGTALFSDGNLMPHLELAHHPVRGSRTYDEYVGRAALKDAGKRKWNRRVARVILILRRLVNFDHLHIGGGSAKHINFDLPPDVSIFRNAEGLTGGFALWRAADAAGPGGDRTAGAAPKRRTPRTAPAAFSGATPAKRSRGRRAGGAQQS